MASTSSMARSTRLLVVAFGELGRDDRPDGAAHEDRRSEAQIVVEEAQDPGFEAPLRPLMTTREVAELTGLSTETILLRWRSGEIPGFRLASNVLRSHPGRG